MEGWTLLVPALLLLAVVAGWLWYGYGKCRPGTAPVSQDTLFDLCPDPMLLVNQDGMISKANAAAHQLLGYSNSSMNGQSIDILIPESIRIQHQHLVSLFFSTTGERRMNNRIWIQDATGRKINGEIHLALVCVNEQPMAFATIRDTTELWKEERKLREQRKAYGELFELSSVGICTVSLGGRFVRVNNHLCELLGYSSEELLDLCFQDITHPDDLDSDVVKVNQLLKGEGTSYTMEKRYFRSGGEIFWAALTVTLIRDEQGLPDYFISVIQDIGDRKESELMLQLSETKFRTIAETIQAVVWMARPDLSEILFVNPAYETVWGRSCASLYGRPQSFFDAIHPDDRELMAEAIHDHRYGSWSIQYRVIHPQDGIRYISDSGKGVSNPRGGLDYLIGLAKDITDQVETRIELEAALKKEQEATERLHQLVRTDPLTGCLNRQALYEELESQLQLYNRYKTPSSILFIDLNDFKQINDTYGHIAGDEALRALSEHILANIRTTDVLARYAGDEFVVVLPHTNVREAAVAARNLRANVLSHNSQGRDFTVHFSIGLAYVGYPDVTSAANWIEIADQAMYLDKAAGNRPSKKSDH
ncbi:MAG: PAS domain S-box protein [Pseudomonadota bacterium]|nr:PAS domain S-box protein [Pseudomonadota bacterium]